MRNRINSLMIAALALALSACAPLPTAQPPATSNIAWQPSARGMDYVRYAPLPDSVVHALRVDLQAHGLSLHGSPPSEKGMSVDTMPSAQGAAASINVSFFSKDFTPRGLTVSDGLAWDPISSQQTSPLMACMDQDRKPRCVIQVAPPFELKPEWRQVIAGTPWLLDQGRRRTVDDDKTCANLCANTHPRTAVGLDASGRWLYIVVAEGRRPPVAGLTLMQLSGVMAELGAHQAINLDGGGSSTLLLAGQSIMARPLNEPALRKVANAFHVRIQAAP